MIEERRLKDINGLQVWKCVENRGRINEEIFYMLNDQDDNNIDVFETLKELKEFAKNWEE